MPQTNFELRRKLLQLEALYDVGVALNTLRPEADLLEELMHRAVAVLDAMTGFVFSIDDKLNVQHLYTFGFDAPAQPNAILSDPAVKQVLSSREPLSVKDRLLAPMISAENIIGMLAVGGKEERKSVGSFVEDDLRFLSSRSVPRRSTIRAISIASTCCAKRWKMKTAISSSGCSASTPTGSWSATRRRCSA